QRKTAFGARGENLRVLLDYNLLNPSYQGRLSIDPLLITVGANVRPLTVHVNVPITLQKDAIQLSDVKLNTDQSQITLNASIQNMNAPRISARLNATVSMPEMQSSLALPIHLQSKTAPKVLSAEASVQIDTKTDLIQVQTAHLGLGGTSFQASGTLDPGKNSAVAFNANLALNELASLFQVSGFQANGLLQANGNAKLDGQNDYAVDGTLNSRDLSLRSGTARIGNVSLYSPFHADPFLISLDGLRLNALGGSLAAKVFVQKSERLSLEGALRNFSVPVLAAAFTGKALGYDGSINGSVKATGDLKAKGSTGFRADANLAISPGARGVPLSGRIDAKYNGPRDSVDLGNSYIALPNSRINLSGTLNRELDVDLNSRNLNDFLPAANFGSTKPATTLPVQLQGGTASLQAQIKGSLSAPQITSRMALSRFAVEGRSFDELSLNLAASRSGATVRDGLLRRAGLRTDFDANIGLRNWSPVPLSPIAANMTLRNGDVADLLALAGESDIPAKGQLSGDIHVNGTYGNPLGSANLEVVHASAYQQPIDHLIVNASLADQLITLSRLELAAGGGRLNVSGRFQHPQDSFMVGHAQLHVGTNNINLANFEALQKQSPGVAGLIQLSADAAGDLRKAGERTEFALSNVTADLNARSLQVQHQNA
ncbi:MAG: hypothetical protein ACJ8LM_17535, partial [Candidatus Udaeobacter sp.]